MANNNIPRTLFESERIKAEKRYKRLLRDIMRTIRTELKKAQTPQDFKRILNRLITSQSFKRLCDEKALQAVTMLARGQMRTWRAAAAASSHGRFIYMALQKELNGTARGLRIGDIVNENSKLIQTVPQTLKSQISNLSMQRQYEGLRPEQVVSEIMQKVPELTETQARRIARTEAAKASTALIQARCEDIGLDFYIWNTCHDGRVRDTHNLMDGIVCRWSDPPDPEKLFGEKSYGAYNPGCIFNCRCVPLPVVDENDLSFPCSVCSGGEIVTVKNIKAFREMFGIARINNNYEEESDEEDTQA